MILKHNDRPIKLIPLKYQVIENITDYLEDFSYIRLSKIERESLDSAMFRQAADKFLEKLEENNKLAHEQVKKAFPMLALRVETSDGQRYYALKMSNGISVRCDEQLYRLAPTRENLRYGNSLNRQIAPPSVEQLRMFE